MTEKAAKRLFRESDFKILITFINCILLCILKIKIDNIYLPCCIVTNIKISLELIVFPIYIELVSVLG